jgi:mono/diheme cytochrome c family protein
MGRLVKWGVGLLAVVLVLVGAGLSYVVLAYPTVAPPEATTVVATPERLARGKYLFDHVALCVDCHSTRDFNKFGGPVMPGTWGKGGEAFTREMGLPGDIYARNITPDVETGIGGWTDGELMRALTTGVNKHGEALFPLMPYLAYGQSDREDIESIAAYVRTLQPIVNHVPTRNFDFPMQLIVRTIPTAAKFAPRPSASDRVAYGGYLTRMASCGECHTPAVQGEPVPGMTFAGGTAFPWPWGGVVRTANITPDADTGIGTWTEDQFVQKFKAFEGAPAQELSAAERQENTVMPWPAYAGMTREDLGAIYAFLRTQKPVVNRVEKFSKTTTR